MYLDWKIAKYIFYTLCVTATIGFIVFCFHEYMLNQDLCLVDFRKFNGNKVNLEHGKYPSVSLCTYSPFLREKLNNKKYGQNINLDSYRNFLAGDYWDEKMLSIDYDDVTIPVYESVIAFGVQNQNWSWVWYEYPAKEEDWKRDGWTGPYISYRSASRKCFTFDIPYLRGRQIIRFGIKLKNTLFANTNFVRPSRNNGSDTGSVGFEVLLHYPLQLVRSAFAGIGKWNWPPRSNKRSEKNYEMTLNIQNINVIVRRNKPAQNDPCDEDWLNYDENAWRNEMDRTGCRSPLAAKYKSIPLCSNKEQMKQVVPLDHEELDKFPLCCRRIEKLQFDYDEGDLPWDGTYGKHGWFQLNIRYGDSIFKEITQVRKYGYQSLIGKCTNTPMLHILLQ